MSTGADPTDDPDPITDAAEVGSGHPIYGHRDASTAERYAWSGAYERYSTHEPIGWGNRARTPHDWVDAVNTFSQDTTNWHPNRRHEIGRFHGVTLHAHIDAGEIRIEARHAYSKIGDYPAHIAPVGQVRLDDVAAWVATQAGHARTERDLLTAQRTASHAQPGPRPQHTTGHGPAR